MPDISLITKNFPTVEDQPSAITSKGWNVQTSPVVSASNPIRTILGQITSTTVETDKQILNLGLGDPTLYNLHPPPPASISAVKEALDSGAANGYLHGSGSLIARQAVADYHLRWDNVAYKADDIVLTHGVAQALDLVLSVLVPPGPGSSVLVPNPGFGLYGALLSSLKTTIRHYSCLEEQGWEIDLDSLESQIDHTTKVIILTNPSNPCGSNYSVQHLQALLQIAERHRIPIIADEIYAHMTWTTFFPLASLSTSVPVITLSGLSKRFLLPGRRFGWAALHDPLDVAGNIREGMHAWAGRFFGPSSIDQAALPAILKTPDSWFKDVMDKVRINAEFAFEFVNNIPGLSCSRPEGALYVFVKIDTARFPDFDSDLDFCTALYREESVFLMPGATFGAKGYFRIVDAVPLEVMREVGHRLAAFCSRHRV